MSSQHILPIAIAAAVVFGWGLCRHTAALGQAASADDAAGAVPDFSGQWARAVWPGFDPPLSGPGPVVNKSRLPNGVGNTRQFVGDYTNPILKQQAADIVRKHGEISLAGIGYPTPANQCWPNRCRTSSGTSGCRCWCRRTRSPFSISSIMRAARYA